MTKLALTITYAKNSYQKQITHPLCNKGLATVEAEWTLQIIQIHAKKWHYPISHLPILQVIYLSVLHTSSNTLQRK